MQKKFITNLAFLLFLNLLIKPFWLLGIDRSVQVATGAEVYGEYYALFNFSFLFNILLDLGITNFNNRNISQNRHLLQKHLSGIILLRTGLAGIYFLVSLTAAFILGYSQAQITMVLILLMNQVLVSFILYLRSNLAGLHLFRVDSIVSVLDRAILIVICGWLLWGRISDEPFRIEWFIWAQTAAYLATIAFLLFFLSRKVTFFQLKWNPMFALMILKKSYPFAILILLMTFYNRVDSVMLERMLADGSRQSGIYAQAYRLMEAANMIAYLFAALLLPMFSHMLKHKQDITKLLNLSYALLAVPAIGLASISFFYNHEIMELLYKENVAESASIFSLLMLSFVAISTTYIYGTLLTANGNLKQLNLMALSGMVLNILLNFFLIPHLFAQGAAISSLVTQSAMALIQVFLCYRIFGISMNFSLFARYLTFIASAIIIVWAFSSLNYSWIVTSIAAIASLFVISLLIKLIDLKSLRDILKNEA